MTADEILALLADLDELAKQVDRGERMILRAALERLAVLDGGGANGGEREVLMGVVSRARAALPLASAGAIGEQ